MIFHWYGLIVGIAIVVGWSVAEKLEPKVSKIAPWVIVAGLLGARAYHVIDEWGYYSQNLNQILAAWNGGMSIWGGMVGGVLGIGTYQLINGSKQQRGDAWSILGAVVTAMPLAQAIGRIANGVNGEFVNRVWFLPWWGMEAVLDLILFGLLGGLALRGQSSQVRVVTYILGYGVIRIMLAPYR